MATSAAFHYSLQELEKIAPEYFYSSISEAFQAHAGYNILVFIIIP